MKAPLFILPTSGTTAYRGKYPNRPRTVSSCPPSGLHIELNNGVRLWTAKGLDHFADLPRLTTDCGEALAKALPMSAGQYEALKEAAALLATRVHIAGHGRRAELDSQVRAMVLAIKPDSGIEATERLPAPAMESGKTDSGIEATERLPAPPVGLPPLFDESVSNEAQAATMAGRESAESLTVATVAPVRRDNVEYHAGRDAFADGVALSACPYAAGGERAARWTLGWQESQAAAAPIARSTVQANLARQREGMAAIADSENPATVAVKAARTIDCAPSWAGILPLLRAGIENGTAEGRRIAWEELGRMAGLADERNRMATGLDEIRGLLAPRPDEPRLTVRTCASGPANKLAARKIAESLLNGEA